MIDGDAQNPIDDVLRMHRRMKDSGADVMKGRRTARSDGPIRRATSIVYNLVFIGCSSVQGASGTSTASPRSSRGRRTSGSASRADDWFIDAEIVLAAKREGLTIGELPVVFRQQRGAVVVRGVSAVLEFLRNMVRHRLRGR